MKTKAQTLSVTELLKLEYVVYATAFLIPLALSQPQPLVGTVVNTLLFIAAARLSKKHLLPLAVLPSISAVLNGVIFGAFTPFLLYFLPFIWISNYILMATFRGLKTNAILKVVAASLIKGAFLFSVAFAYVNVFHIVPKVFLVAMGPLQIGTALAGGVVALGVLKLLDRSK